MQENARKLRSENKAMRERLHAAEARAEDYAKRLHTELVRADGRLHDTDDLPFADEHLTSPDALAAGIDALQYAKPHLGRRPSGDIGMGARGSNDVAPRDFSALFR
jgi:hypothetical protein